MAVIAIPILEAAVEALGPALLRAGAALLGSAAVAGTASLSGDTTKDESKATPLPRTLPRTGERCKKCPPDAGFAANTRHRMSPAAREYQAYITGRPYGIDPYNDSSGWNEEWEWRSIDWDGFVPAECLLQEAKGDYDQFLEMPWAGPKFKGFVKMRTDIIRQANAVRMHPPTRLKWYFQTPKVWKLMLEDLDENGVLSECVPKV